MADEPPPWYTVAVRDFNLSDVDKVRLFPGAIPREQAGLLPIEDIETDWRKAPALVGQRLMAFWDRQFAVRNDNSRDGTEWDRAHAAWRITRQLAIARGIIQPDDPIEEVGSEIPWTQSEFTSFVEVRDAHLRTLIGAGAPMTCPPVPDAFLTPAGEVSQEYNPYEDAPLVRFQRLVHFFGQACLMLDQSDRTCRGFVWFESPESIRAGWPSPPVLSFHECRLIEETVELIAGSGDMDAAREIAARWDLMPNEVQQLVALARAALAARARLDDRDGYKALIIARLDVLAAKAEDALDHRGAAQIRREQWRIFEARAEQDIADEFGDMSNAISLSASERRRRLLPKPKD